MEGGTEAQRRTFYTALYHAVQFPHMLQETDASGKMVHWSPYDGKVHPGEMFADNGFWDTFRAQFPLLTILEPKKDAEIIRAMLNAYDEGGFIPKWPNPGETNVMIGTHGDSVIADAYLKGIRDYDVAKAYAALSKDATEKGAGVFQARSGIEDYIKLGYVPYDHGVHESVACTLEYAYDDFAVAQMAKALGKDEDYKVFLARTKNYRNLYDARVGFMRGRKSDGSWIEPFDPLAWGGVYTEGNAWQWLWSVQQDVPGLMELMGGKDGFIKKLDALFTATTGVQGGRIRAGDPRDDRSQDGGHGPVRAHQRAGPSRRVSVRLRRPAVEDAAPGAHHRRPPVQAGTRRLAGRRGYRPDVVLVYLQRAGILSGESGPADLRAGQSAVRPRHDPPGERQELHGRSGQERLRAISTSSPPHSTERRSSGPGSLTTRS